MTSPPIRREKVRTERFRNPTTATGYQIHVPADVTYRAGLALCERPIKPHLLFYTDAEPTCRKCLAMLESVVTPEASLEELARLGVEFNLSHIEGEWVLASEHGFARDCTLSSCIERVLKQERERPTIGEAVAEELARQRTEDLPPLTSAILARERDRRGTHPLDFINESGGE